MRQQWPERFEVRRLHIGHFAEVVIAPHPHRGVIKGFALKHARFLVRHWPALQVQAFARSLGQPVVVVRFFPAKIALRRDVQPRRGHDLLDEQAPQQVCADVLVPRVHALVGDVLPEIVAKMAVVVHQAGGDDDGRFSRRPGKRGALQGVLQFGNRFTVLAMATLTLDRDKIVEGLRGRMAAMR